MVKNTQGGKHKNQARKFSTGNQRVQNKLRVAEDDCEIYSQVEKLLGNGMCYVIGTDGKKRLCVIRGKFRGRGKRDNTLVNGTWCLIGLRDYLSEPAEGELEKCDLLEVYSDSDKQRLKSQLPGIDWSRFLSVDAANSLNTLDKLDIEFADNKKEDYKKLMEEQISGGSVKILDLSISNDSGSEENDQINIDDI
jgi:initiation factor 1A